MPLIQPILELRYDIGALRQIRENMLTLLSDLSTEQLNTVPPGFRNTLAWNLGHVIVTQQLLCYERAGLPLLIRDEWAPRFRKGTFPGEQMQEEERALFRRVLLEVVSHLEEDYFGRRFLRYNAYTTSMGIALNSIEEAIRYNNIHETLHLGYMMAMKRVLLTPA